MTFSSYIGDRLSQQFKNVPSVTVTAAVSATSAASDSPAGVQGMVKDVLIQNTGANFIYVRWADAAGAAATAVTTDTRIAPDNAIALENVSFDRFAYRSDAGLTSEVRLTFMGGR